MLLKNALMVFMFLLLTGCAAANIMNQSDKLDSAMNQYGADLRWDRMKHAYQFHMNRDGQRPEVDLEALEKYSVTDFKPANPALNAEATEAVVPVEIDYYDEEYGTLRKIKETQNWWYDTEAKVWLIESEFPAFK